MKRIGIIISILLILMGFTGFIGGLLITTGVIDYNNELPLGDITGLVVDDKEYIYVGLGFYGKVQVYDNNGEFVKNWRVNSSGGAFNIQLTDNQNFLIATTSDQRILYNQNGKVLSSETIDNIYSQTNRAWNTFTTDQGEEYEIKGGIFPKIIRTSPDEKIMVKQGLLLQLMKGPFPVWLIAALGMGLYFILRKDKIKKQMEKYTMHN